MYGVGQGLAQVVGWYGQCEYQQQGQPGRQPEREAKSQAGQHLQHWEAEQIEFVGEVFPA